MIRCFAGKERADTRQKINSPFLSPCAIDNSFMEGTPWHPALCLVLCTALSLACAGCISNPTPRAFSTNTDYKLQILSTEPLYNVTFYLPLPVKNGTPMAGPLVLTKEYFAQGNVSVDIVRSPPGGIPAGVSRDRTRNRCTSGSLPTGCTRTRPPAPRSSTSMRTRPCSHPRLTMQTRSTP